MENNAQLTSTSVLCLRRSPGELEVRGSPGHAVYPKMHQEFKKEPPEEGIDLDELLSEPSFLEQGPRMGAAPGTTSVCLPPVPTSSCSSNR